MPQYIVTITDNEKKALLSDMISIQDWIDNAIHNKARQCTDTIVDVEIKRIQADSNITSMPTSRKEIFAAVNIETAANRQARVEKEIKTL